MRRRRLLFVALALGTTGLGLIVRLHGGALSPVVRDVLGDMLWAAMVTWLIAVLAPAMRLPLRAVLALAFAFIVELSQLYHAPALDTIRQTTIGHLVLGSDFDPRDFLGYAAGVVVAMLLDRQLAARSRGGVTR